MTRTSFVLAAVVFATAATAQTTGGAGDRAQAELARSQRQLEQNKGEVNRLLEMRLRHDLGLPADDHEAATYRPTAVVTTESMERARQELRDEDAATAALLDRYKKLKGEVDLLQADAKARAATGSRGLVVPPANTALSRPPNPAAVPPAAGNSVPPSAAPLAEPAPAAAMANVVAAAKDLGLDPVRGQIHGSNDHQRVAQALFKAGQVLMDRADAARSQRQDAQAKELDTRAKERLVRAIDELAPLLKDPTPGYPTLFYLGRCRELLFRLAQRYDGLSLANSTRDWQQREQEVREPFLAITARDVRKKGERGEIEVLGAWGTAAQTAMEHFRWLNLHGGYDPRPTIEALTWPGERQQ